MRFFYAVVIVLAITTFISWLNYYLLSRIFASYRTRVVKYACIFFAVATILVMDYGWLRRSLFILPEIDGVQFYVYVALAWSFGQLILLALQPLIYIGHRLIKGYKAEATAKHSSSTASMTRRQFLHNALAITPLFAFGISTKGIYGAQTDMAVQRFSLTMPQLPPNLAGFKIGQISDIHLGPYFDLERLDTALQLLAQEEPDLVVITGDLIDDLTLLKPAIDRLNDLQTAIPYGVYFCMGNHDYFEDAELVRSELSNSRIVLLDNSIRQIIPGPQPFCLIGVDYAWAGLLRRGIEVSDSKRQQYFAAAIQDVPLNSFSVLIGHHPDVLFDGFNAKIPLTLAGHTHGGQVVIGGKTFLSSYYYIRGLYSENGVYGYVSSGAGHWLPFRLGCPPEISMFTLKG
ncbi:MAG: metallophosphoesterase [Negativicutes bacterium]